MSLSDNTTKVFIHHSLLMYECGVEKLREYLSKFQLEQNQVITEICDDALVVLPALPAQQHYSLTDTRFQYFVTQKVQEGYIFISVATLKNIVGLSDDE